MRRLLGAVCVGMGCLLPVMERVGRERRLIRTLGELADSLDALRRMLERNAPDTETLLRSAAQREGPVGAFYRSVPLDGLGSRPFAELWRTALEQSNLLPVGEERLQMEQVGQVLGSCALGEQCSRLAAAAEALRSCRVDRRNALRQNRRLWYTLSASAGGLLVMTVL